MKKLLLFFFCFYSLQIFAESIPKDAALWTTFSIDKKITRRWAIGFDQEFRLNNNVSNIDLFYSNLGISYRVNSFKFSLVYRFINKNRDNDFYSKRHRVYFDAAYRYKLNKWTLGYRFRTQGQLKDYYSSDDGKYVESNLRHKIDISYDMDKFTPYFGAEYFYQLNSPGFKEGNNLWNSYRYFLGCDYEINRMHSVSLYYMVQHDFNTNNPMDTYIVGAGYGINL